MAVGIRGLAVLGACSAAVIVASAVVAGQAGTAPRTPWGAPDLQGIWSNPTVVPFERA
jgi:hypothetical protein